MASRSELQSFRCNLNGRVKDKRVMFVVLHEQGEEDVEKWDRQTSAESTCRSVL